MSLWPRRATRIHNPTLQSPPSQPPRSFWLLWVIALRGLVATCLTRTRSATALQIFSFAFSGSFLRLYVPRVVLCRFHYLKVGKASLLS